MKFSVAGPFRSQTDSLCLLASLLLRHLIYGEGVATKVNSVKPKNYEERVAYYNQSKSTH